MDPEAPNVLHVRSCSAAWSRQNEKGAFPGVATPLSWSIWGETGERAVRLAAFDLGLLDAHELAPPAEADEWMWSVFYGRPSANVESWRRLYERASGEAGGGSAAESLTFGTGRAREARAQDAGRAALVAAKTAAAAAEAPGRMRARRAEAEALWRETTSDPRLADAGWCRARFAELHAAFARTDHVHILVSLLCANAIADATALAAEAGLAAELNQLLGGYPDMEEFCTARALWEVAQGRRSFEAFLAEHGFRGSQEGEASSRSWREAPEPARALARSLAAEGPEDDPLRREERAAREREALEARLLEALPPDARARAGEVLARAATFVPLREAGKAALIVLLDALRACARGIGRELAANGALASAEDVFQLTRAELLELPPDARELVAARRLLRAHYESFELPDAWQGMPEKLALAVAVEAAAAGCVLRGIGVGAGSHEGIARVVLDPATWDGDFDAGDVLVAPATDPSWAPLFLVAGAVVIDAGTAFSHAALVAREMGIPGVVSTQDGSRRLRSGQRLRVDGGAGTVTVLPA